MFIHKCTVQITDIMSYGQYTHNLAWLHCYTSVSVLLLLKSHARRFSLHHSGIVICCSTAAVTHRRDTHSLHCWNHADTHYDLLYYIGEAF